MLAIADMVDVVVDAALFANLLPIAHRRPFAISPPLLSLLLVIVKALKTNN